jgi:multiple sugar transport system substrate-binding protein
MKIPRIAAVGAATLLLALAACGGGGSPSGSGSGSGSGPVTLKFQSLAFLPGSQAATKKIVDDFNTANPNIKVDLIQGSWDSVHDQLVTQFAGGTAPDIVHDESADMTGFAQGGYLADLSSTLDPAIKGDISPGVLDSVTVSDKLIAAPTVLQSYLVFANKKMLDQAGVTIPTGPTMTWDQFAAISKQVNDKLGKPGVGWGLKSPTASFLNLALGFGGKFFDGTGKDAKITVGDPELEVPKRIMAMAADGSLDKSTLTQSGSDVLPAWYAGKFAMTVQGSYAAGSFGTDAPKGFDWVALPALAGTEGAAQAANPQTLSVSADSKHVQQASDFISFYMKAENLAAVAEGETLFPSTKGAQDAVIAKTGGKDGWSQIVASGTALKKAPFQSVDNYPQWKDQIATPAFQQFLAGKTDAAGLQKALTDGWTTVNR